MKWPTIPKGKQALRASAKASRINSVIRVAHEGEAATLQFAVEFVEPRGSTLEETKERLKTQPKRVIVDHHGKGLRMILDIFIAIFMVIIFIHGFFIGVYVGCHNPPKTLVDIVEGYTSVFGSWNDKG